MFRVVLAAIPRPCANNIRVHPYDLTRNSPGACGRVICVCVFSGAKQILVKLPAVLYHRPSSCFGIKRRLVCLGVKFSRDLRTKG